NAAALTSGSAVLSRGLAFAKGGGVTEANTGTSIETGVYDFYRHRTVPWALVVPTPGVAPVGVDLAHWTLTRTRSPAETQQDVRHEVDERGYCLIESECTFDQLAAELRASAGGDAQVRPDSADADAAPAAEYAFYVHRTLRPWRLALRSRDPVPALTRMSD